MSYSLADAMVSLVNEVRGNLPLGIADEQVSKPGAKFKTPTADNWLRLTFSDSVPDENTPNCYFRDECFFAVDFFYAKDNGIIQLTRDVEAMRALLRNRNIGNASAFNATIKDLGEDGPWFHKQLLLTFTYEGL
jgi:hypothetical protein